jgi:hypothetical protein
MFVQNMQGGFLQRVVFEELIYNSKQLFGNRRSTRRKRVDTCDATQTDAEPLTNHDILNAT